MEAMPFEFGVVSWKIKKNCFYVKVFKFYAVGNEKL